MVYVEQPDCQPVIKLEMHEAQELYGVLRNALGIPKDGNDFNAGWDAAVAMMAANRQTDSR